MSGLSSEDIDAIDSSLRLRYGFGLNATHRELLMEKGKLALFRVWKENSRAIPPRDLMESVGCGDEEVFGKQERF